MDSTEARQQAERILRNAGVSAEALQAKRNIDARLAGIGLPPTSSAPIMVSPGRRLDVGTGAPKYTLQASNEQRIEQLERRAIAGQADEGRAVSAILLSGGVGADPPHVALTEDMPNALGEATWEPSDLSGPTAVTSLGTTAGGGTEVKFNLPGIVYVGSGAIGVYWARSLGANQNTWSPCLPGMRLAYHPQGGLFFGTSSAGGIRASGALILAFYKMPAGYKKQKNAWREWHKQVGEWTEGSGSDNALGVIAQSLAVGANSGTDVTLGTFSDAGAGTQIFKAGTNFPVAGAVTQGGVILNASNANTDVIWIAETTVLAVASNGALGALGQDINNRAVGTKLFMLANSGTQVLGARYRS